MSHFDKTITTWMSGSPSLKKRIAGFHPSLNILIDSNDRDAVDQLQFYEEWKKRSLGSRVNWGDHVGSWVATRPPQIAFIRYEDMRTEPEHTLAKAVAKLSDGLITEQSISFAVERNSFEAQTGRQPGQKDANSTKRMGIVGSWKTQMPIEIQSRFLSDFGNVLQQAGYED